LNLSPIEENAEVAESEVTTIADATEEANAEAEAEEEASGGAAANGSGQLIAAS